MNRPLSTPLFEVPSRQASPLANRLRRLEAAPTPGWLSESAPEPCAEEAGTAAPTAPEPAPPVPPLDVEAIRAAAEAEGMKAAQGRIDATIDRYLDGIRRAERMARESARPDASEIVALALVVARELIGHEASIEPEGVVAAIRSGLQALPTTASVRVRVAPTDLEHLQRRRRDPDIGAIEWLADETLSPGGCIIETPDRVIDASNEARIAAVRESLVDLLRSPLESAILSVVAG